MANCAYCNTELEKTGGKLYVAINGSRDYFCSSKCEKNWKRGRNLEYAEADA